MSGIVIVIFILRILLVALLFGFLVWAVAAIWRDLLTQGRYISAPMIPALTLAHVNSSEEPHDQETFTGPEVIIGRSMSSDYAVADETVSARHARFSFHHNQWWVEDFRSTNGTFLNDERVTVSTVIVSGDQLQVGQVNLLIEIANKGQA